MCAKLVCYVRVQSTCQDMTPGQGRVSSAITSETVNSSMNICYYVNNLFDANMSEWLKNEVDSSAWLFCNCHNIANLNLVLNVIVRLFCQFIQINWYLHG